jgi:hypothetical protein
VLAKIVHVIEMAGLQIGIRRADVRHCGLAQNIGGDIFDRRIRDFLDKADVLVFSGRDPGDNLTPCDFGIDDGLTAAATVIDHHNKYCMLAIWPSVRMLESDEVSISENQK